MDVGHKSALDLFIIAKVKEFRMSQKMTQATLALRLEVSDGFIGMVESPKYRAKYNLDHLNKMAGIFGCSPKDFLPQDPIFSS